MRRVFLIAVVIATGLLGCGGGSEQSGFTGLTKIPNEPADFHFFYPSTQMAEEAEDLVDESSVAPDFGSADCLPAKSLEGVGEFNFDCTAFDSEKGRRHELDVVIHGSNTGEDPEVSIGEYVGDDAKRSPARVLGGG